MVGYTAGLSKAIPCDAPFYRHTLVRLSFETLYLTFVECDVGPLQGDFATVLMVSVYVEGLI